MTDGIFKSPQLPRPEVALPTDALSTPAGSKRQLTAITTTWFKYSHADDIITKFIEGYAMVSRIHEPHCEVVSLYLEQTPETDIGRGLAARYGIRSLNHRPRHSPSAAIHWRWTACCWSANTAITRSMNAE